MRNGEVRLLGEDGMQLGVMSMAEALRRAEEANLALGAVQSGADPPVYRLMDDYSYECHRREQERRAYERQKVQEIVGLKEVRWRPMADAHELDTKRRAIRTWLAEGATVRLTVRMRGRELAHPDAARATLLSMIASLADVGHVERDVLDERHSLSAILAPGADPPRHDSNNS